MPRHNRDLTCAKKHLSSLPLQTTSSPPNHSDDLVPSLCRWTGSQWINRTARFPPKILAIFNFFFQTLGNADAFTQPNQPAFKNVRRAKRKRTAVMRSRCECGAKKNASGTLGQNIPDAWCEPCSAPSTRLVNQETQVESQVGGFFKKGENFTPHQVAPQR